MVIRTMSDSEAFWLGFFIGGIMFIAVGALIGGIASDEWSAKYVNVEANVTSVEMHDNLGYMTVSFDNGAEYNININTGGSGSGTVNYNNYVDFDQSDHVIVRLRWSSGWFSQNPDNRWGIVSLVKY
jgi:hypothetical protein